jgi:hypothetical protein
MPQQSDKTTLLAIVVGLVVLAGATFLDPFKWETNDPFEVQAGTATTSVTVLNTPPLWSVDAQEYIESSTSSPTNAGTNVVWVGTAHDDNAESYYLLICKTTSTPTANSNNPPTCAGGAGNQWAVSASTASDVQATSTYTTTSTDPQINVWVAWICDGNGAFPQCNTTFKQGTGTSSSPFVVNHWPAFTAATDNSPAIPGAVVTWFTSSSDPDNFTGASDTVRLWVCKANDFSAGACGAGGTYCSSTLSTANPSCSSTLAIPFQDGNWPSHTYVVDQRNFAAASTTAPIAQATDTILVVSNVAPTISSSSISLQDPSSATSSLTLTGAQAETAGFKVVFTAADNNACQNKTSGAEILATSSIVNVYRSGLGQASCTTAGQYNPNNCYPAAATSSWTISCSQNGGSCSGATDSDAIFTCTFPLWYVADPTDGANATDTQFFAQTWISSVRATDDNGATSTLVEASSGNELLSFLAYTLNTSAIAYGSLSPGSSTNPIVATTTVTATGNVGLDETLYGDDMCTTYPSCAVSVTSTISIVNQKYATSSVGYASSTAFAAAANPGSTLQINIRKSTVTSTPATGTTFWGIQIPATITLAGDYTGKNTIIGIKGEAQSW